MRIDALDLFKHREVANEIEEDLGLELTLDEGFKLGGEVARLRDAIRGLPGKETAPIRREASRSGIEPIGDHKEGVVGEEVGDVVLVRLELLPSRLNGACSSVARFNSMTTKGRPLTKSTTSGMRSALVLHLELVDDKEVVLI